MSLRVIIAVSALAGVLIAVPAQADTKDDLDAARQELASKQADLDALTLQWQQTETAYAQAQDAAREAQRQIGTLQAQLTKLQRRFDEQVRAVYISGGNEAIGALEGLRSVARTGVTYREYAPRVSEAQVVVDLYLKKEDGAPAIRGAIADSFHFYALAGAAWNAGLSRGNYATVGTDAALARCAHAQRVIAESKRKSPFIWRAKGAGEGATTGMVIATDGIAALWSCASDKLAEAEKLR